MNQELLPTIKVELQSVKSNILYALGMHGSEIGKIIEQSLSSKLDAMINNCPEYISKTVEEVIKDAVIYELKYGATNRIIVESVREAISKLFKTNNDND